MSRLAVAVTRFGPQITGGAEKLAREVALRLAGSGHEVTVLTTCAEDYVTWADTLPAGESADGPLRVLRFPVRRPRDLAEWERTMQPILRGAWTAADEEAVLLAAGPDVPGLLDHLREHGAGYDAVIFFTLLYHPTVAGVPLVWDRAILVPTLHDELAAHLHAHARTVRLARALLWLTPEERELAEQLYDAADLPGEVAGVGVEPPPSPEPGRARRRFGLERPYLLYAGRIDAAKGCGEMLDAFTAWAEHDPRCDLVLAGRLWMDLPDHPRIRHLGVVTPAELWDLQAGAAATVVPSRLESLSMLALESMAVGVPVLVPSGSPVLEGHVRRSGAGRVYGDAGEFAAAATELLDHPDLAAALGEAGRAYVRRGYTWAGVEEVVERTVARVARRAAGVA